MSEDTPAKRLKEVIQRFQTIRQPLVENRKLRRKAFLDTLLDSLKARTEAKTTRSEVVSVEDLIEENKRLKEKLKGQQENEESHGIGRYPLGVHTTKKGRDIAIEL
jgi:hypothetical protein